MVQRQMDYLFLRIRGIAKQGFGDHFITSSSSYFFNKTDLEQYIFNNDLHRNGLKKLNATNYTIIKLPEIQAACS